MCIPKYDFLEVKRARKVVQPLPVQNCGQIHFNKFLNSQSSAKVAAYIVWSIDMQYACTQGV